MGVEGALFARHLLSWGIPRKEQVWLKGFVINHDLEPLGQGQGLKLCKLGVKKHCKSYLAHLFNSLKMCKLVGQRALQIMI